MRRIGRPKARWVGMVLESSAGDRPFLQSRRWSSPPLRILAGTSPGGGGFGAVAVGRGCWGELGENAELAEERRDERPGVGKIVGAQREQLFRAVCRLKRR